MRLSIIFSLGILVCHAQSGLLTDPRDGKTYKTIQIGSQIWMAENLNYAPSNLSQMLTFTGSELPAFCYDDDLSNCDIYGGLYIWDVATKVCPSGWHLPSKGEFEILFSFIGGDKRNQYGALIKGGNSGFDAILGGWLYFSSMNSSSFHSINKIGSYWTSTEKERKKIYAMCVWLSTKTIDKDMIGSFSKKGGHSVRCIKDQ